MLRRVDGAWKVARRTIVLDANVLLDKNLSVFSGGSSPPPSVALCRKDSTCAVYSSGFSNGGQWPQLFRSTSRESAMWLRMAMLTSKATIRS